MKKLSIFLIMILVLSMALFACGSQQEGANNEPQAEPVEIHVFAAASMTDALNDIITAYAAESQDTIIPVYEASGTLREQIENGADCDIFISANQSHMNTLEEEALLAADTRKDLLGNSLTLIASAEVADNAKTLAEADFNSVFTDPTITYIAMGEPTEVPAGQYAKEMLENLGIFSDIESKIVYAKNVKAVLTYVDGGDAEVGFVYKTDALTLTSGKYIMDCPADSYTPVSYPSAILAAAPQPEAAANFYEFLQSDAAKTIFEGYGFSVLA